MTKYFRNLSKESKRGIENKEKVRKEKNADKSGHHVRPETRALHATCFDQNKAM
jgi:hypothetical protein